MGERAEPHALVVGAGDHRCVCAVEAPADAVVAGVDSAAGRHGGGGAEGERVHEKRKSGGWLCTRHALLTHTILNPTNQEEAHGSRVSFKRL